VWQACVFLLLLAVFAEETSEQKKVDKRGLLGLGYGYGHGLAYAPAVVSSPAVSYTKVSSQQDVTKTNRTAKLINLTHNQSAMKCTIFWDVMSCTMVVYRRFGGMHLFHV
jgi:hypothetical protein